MRINVGSGPNPVIGWKNFDNSLSVRLAKIPFIPDLLSVLKLLNEPQYELVRVARSHKIEFADITRKLPISDGSVEVLYSSHMLEHLDPIEASLFMKEARRVLKPGGIIRLVLPDIHKHVQDYIENRDADAFIEKTLLTQQRPRRFAEKIKYLVVGSRNHQWMYDGESLSRLLRKSGFVNVSSVPAGETRIQNPNPLDLFERVEESVYVEGENP